uniref:Uncharacterized protein n=1 Tax=Populus alba TaxID=43335 RepID=A0A4U5PTN7_POPAL|nr:hypothetical protein D5086_0000180890 [Populus alba]
MTHLNSLDKYSGRKTCILEDQWLALVGFGSQHFDFEKTGSVHNFRTPRTLCDVCTQRWTDPVLYCWLMSGKAMNLVTDLFLSFPSWADEWLNLVDFGNCRSNETCCTFLYLEMNETIQRCWSTPGK